MKTICISGNLTKDCELRKTQTGLEVAGFSVAVNDRRTKEVIYFDCSYWGKGGSAVSPWLKKGQSVVINGDFGTREYNGKTYLTCNVNSLDLTGNKTNQSNDSSYQAFVPQSNDLDDEIPF